MRLIALASLLISFSTLACPDLSGAYKICQSSRTAESSPGMKVSQRNLNGVTTYRVETENPYTGMNEAEEMIADGMARIQDEGSDEDLLFKKSFICEGESLLSDTMIEQTRDRATYVLKMTTIVRKIDGKLVIESDNHIVLEEDGTITTHPYPETIICD